ncbi:MAG: cytochrome C [Pseudomonadota bacterium]
MTHPALRLTMLLLPAAILAACGGGGTTTTPESAAAPTVLLAAVQTDTAAGTAADSGAGSSGSAATTSAESAAVARSAATIAPAPVPNDEGASLTLSTSGPINTANPFFKPMGNGRACVSCHQVNNGMSISPPNLLARFTSSNGTDPVFRVNDGATSPLAPVATLDQKRSAYSMLLNKGLIRVGLPMPAGADFTLVKVDDPYKYASAKELSLFRRPLPSTNLKFASSVMWDGRETFADATSTTCIFNARPALCFASINFDLRHQSNDAVRGHAEAAQDLSALDQRAIVDFEKSLFTAQVSSKDAGDLTSAGALAGTARLVGTNFYFGINDIDAGDYRSHAPFNRNVMTLFGAWRNLATPAPPRRGAPPPPPPSAQDQARASIARGEQIFNNRPFNIVGVAGFNDDLRLPLQRGTCASCHDTPNVGTQSVARMFNTGVSNAQRRTPDLPLYTLRNNSSGEVIETTDPGAAMLSGKWKDIGKVKVPSLRGIESRSPYFHDGSVDKIEDIVGFYDRRFRMGLTRQEVADLSAFLKAL